MHGVMLRPLGRSLSPAPSLDDDPLGAFRAARADVEALLDDPALAATECDTPMGRMTLEQHVDGVVSEDMVLHGWDLARATGQDDTIDPAEIDRLWPGVQDIPAEMRIPGAFGPGHRRVRPGGRGPRRRPAAGPRARPPRPRPALDRRRASA